MLCKYYLQLGCYTLDTTSPDCMEVSSMIKNLDSIKVSYTRVDLGGVVRKCGSSLEFTGKAYDAIISHYENNYLQSKGVFAVFIADNNWEYSKVWECPLDFATLQYDANVLTIGCVDNSIASVIKANKKSKYEFDVSSLKESESILYNGVITRRTFSFIVTGATPAGESTTDMVSSRNVTITPSKGYYSMYIPYIGVSVDNFVSEKITCYDQHEDDYWSNGYNGNDDGVLMKYLMDRDMAGFITCITDCSIHIDMDIHFTNLYGDWWNARTTIKAYFILVVGDNVVWRKEVTDFNSVDVGIHGDFAMSAGQKMAFGLSFTKTQRTNWSGYRMPDGSENPNTDLILNPGLRWASNTNTAYVDDSHYAENPINIDTIKPISLLQRIIDEMFAQYVDAYVKGYIEEGESLLTRTLLVAAESVRSISTNKIYSSFSEFCDFMESVFGYVYIIEDIGYLMDIELDEIDRGVRHGLTHIKMSYLTSNSMGLNSNSDYDRMLPIGGIIGEDLGDMLDMTTEYEYRYVPGLGVSYMKEVFYNVYANTFVVRDYRTGMYYSNFVRNDAVIQGNWYNDSDGHAREMIGLNIGTYNRVIPLYMYGIIRNGSIISCYRYHDQTWLGSKENNERTVGIKFKHRTEVFKSATIKSLANVNNLSFQFDEGKVFSDVEVGYAKKNYDNNNSALNEFNFTNYYKTDCDLTEKTLSLICPYRADCYGIEELLVKSNGSEATDSDNDIFIVIASGTQPIEGNWQIDRSIPVQNAYTETVFNAAIAPNKIVLNNSDYLGSCCKKLKFTSSDANSSAVIGDTPMSANINITKQLFKVGKISIDTDDHHIPENWDGIIEFTYAGKTYKGYLDSIDINFAKMGTITYNLIEKCIE